MRRWFKRFSDSSSTSATPHDKPTNDEETAVPFFSKAETMSESVEETTKLEPEKGAAGTLATNGNSDEGHLQTSSTNDDPKTSSDSDGKLGEEYETISLTNSAAIVANNNETSEGGEISDASKGLLPSNTDEIATDAVSIEDTVHSPVDTPVLGNNSELLLNSSAMTENTIADAADGSATETNTMEVVEEVALEESMVTGNTMLDEMGVVGLLLEDIVDQVSKEIKETTPNPEQTSAEEVGSPSSGEAQSGPVSGGSEAPRPIPMIQVEDMDNKTIGPPEEDKLVLERKSSLIDRASEADKSDADLDDFVDAEDFEPNEEPQKEEPRPPIRADLGASPGSISLNSTVTEYFPAKDDLSLTLESASPSPDTDVDSSGGAALADLTVTPLASSTKIKKSLFADLDESQSEDTTPRPETTVQTLFRNAEESKEKEDVPIPTKTNKTVEDKVTDVEQEKSDLAETSIEESSVVHFPDPEPQVKPGEIPVEKAAYQIDWDNFDESQYAKPFGTSGAQSRSKNTTATKPAKQTNPNPDVPDPKAQGGSEPKAKDNSEEGRRGAEKRDLKSEEREGRKMNEEEGVVGGEERGINGVPEDGNSSAVLPDPPPIPPHRKTSPRPEGNATMQKISKPEEQSSSIVPPEVPITHGQYLANSAVTDPQPSTSPPDEFVMANSENFGDAAFLDGLQSNEQNTDFSPDTSRQSLYEKFDPLVTPMTTKTIKQTTANPTTTTTSNRLAAGKSEEDLMVMKSPSPQANGGTNKGRGTPSTVVKKQPSSTLKQHLDKTGEGMIDIDELGIDRMLSISPGQVTEGAMDSLMGQKVDKTVREIFQKEEGLDLGNGDQEGQMEAVTQRLKLQFQAVLLAKEREWGTQFQKQQRQNEKLASEVGTARRESDQAKQSSSEMRLVVSEYEKTMAQLMSEITMLRQNGPGDSESLLRDRDMAVEDLRAVETAFAEQVRRYEKLRTATEEFKKNEEGMRVKLIGQEAQLKKADEKYHQLRERAQDKLERANEEIERLIKAKDTDTLALRAQLKKRDLQVETMQRNVETKQKEIQELTSICDELIQKAGDGVGKK